jgi:glycosyltransferase involved in cell wall biosynthesis
VKSISKPKRFFSELLLQKKIWDIGKNELPSTIDLVITYSPSIFWAYLINKIKYKYNANSYLVLRDIFPQWALDLKIITKFNPIYWILKYFEHALYSSSSMIGLQSPENLNYFHSRSELKKYTVELLYNWTSQDEHPQKYKSVREQYDLKEKVIFFYGGNLGIAQDLFYVLDCAHELQKIDHIHFLLIGEGSEKLKLRKKLCDLDIHNVTIIDSLPRKLFDAVLIESDVGIISLSPDFRTQNIPGKLMSYLKYSKPVLASVNPGNDLVGMINSGNFGVSCTGRDKENFISNVIFLAGDQNNRTALGQNGKKFLNEYFDVKNAANQILESINTSIRL